MSTNYRDWLQSFDHDDHGKAAVAALDDLGRLSLRSRTLLLPILTEAVLMLRRGEARTVERAVNVSCVFEGATTLDTRRRLLDASFALGDGRRVAWAEATVADHRERIEYLTAHITGLRLTIGQHEGAIALIEAHHVTCLAEVEAAA